MAIRVIIPADYSHSTSFSPYMDDMSFPFDNLTTSTKVAKETTCHLGSIRLELLAIPINPWSPGGGSGGGGGGQPRKARLIY